MSILLPLTAALYVMSGVLSLVHSARRAVSGLRGSSLGMLAAGLVTNALWIVTSWHSLGHPPFAELHGCLVLLAVCVAMASLTLELQGEVRFVGGLSSLAAAGVLMAGARFAGEWRPLMPALQSPYFAPHVLSYFVAYGALTVSGLASLVFLAARGLGRGGDAGGAVFLDGVETWILRSARIGFPFLTLGLVLGAVWAQRAYTDYWSWDPKEVWALITWLVVAGWFHLWRTGRRGVLAAVIMALAAGALYFTLFGVNFLPTARQSLHTYIESSGP
jgi:ABC-type transport system involved in cytochrome c biogenesis permease subunit